MIHWSGFGKKAKDNDSGIWRNISRGAIDLAELTHFDDWRKNTILLIVSQLAYILRSRF
jgi:hypothetical protein